ncbi:ATP adenylyltransferase-like protein [Caballeronia insecticola]|uniref:ATP adenylyltransferase-like protein n=1 Tax=Caballeronia insecticola TaxID=758793 RepID=R4X2H3_9BURK|nr:ATP adenylyltransferase-like protein [Caballeronia insecticola]
MTQTERALACGALRSFETVQRVIEDSGVRFLVRQAANLARKEEASKLAAKTTADAASTWRDPFSPCEESLRVGDIGERHFLLLNKFNVLAHHLLVVTTDFEPQESLINADDFAALFACLDRFEGLGFYNGGEVAGSSQPHKHLQIVPLPLDADASPALPIEPCIEAARTSGVFRAPQLAFTHAAAWLDRDDRDHRDHRDNDAKNAHATYLQLLNAIGIEPLDVAGVAHQSAPYNLLVTRRWMLAVPRRVSHVEGVAVNALGFAGSLFVRDDVQRGIVESRGPMKLLADATIS